MQNKTQNISNTPESPLVPPESILLPTTQQWLPNAFPQALVLHVLGCHINGIRENVLYCVMRLPFCYRYVEAAPSTAEHPTSEYTTACLSNPLLVGLWVGSSSQLSWIRLLVTLPYMSFCKRVFISLELLHLQNGRLPMIVSFRCRHLGWREEKTANARLSHLVSTITAPPSVLQIRHLCQMSFERKVSHSICNPPNRSSLCPF